MTNPNYAHYVLIVDRSGSMWSTAEDATGGIRQFLLDQQGVLPVSTLSLYQFDTRVDKVHDFSHLTAGAGYTLKPRGNTALFDAIGLAVTEVGEKLAVIDESARPGKVVVLIVTDGQNNASQEYTRDQVKELLTRQQEEYGWAVSYIGANVDAFEEGGSMGLSANTTLSYVASGAGTRGSYAAASSMVTRGVKGGGFEYTDTERDDATKAD